MTYQTSNPVTSSPNWADRSLTRRKPGVRIPHRPSVETTTCVTSAESAAGPGNTPGNKQSADGSGFYCEDCGGVTPDQIGTRRRVWVCPPCIEVRRQSPAATSLAGLIDFAKFKGFATGNRPSGPICGPILRPTPEPDDADPSTLPPSVWFRPPAEPSENAAEVLPTWPPVDLSASYDLGSLQAIDNIDPAFAELPAYDPAAARSWWLLASPNPIALPKYLARAYRRAGRPVVYGTHAEAVGANTQERISA